MVNVAESSLRILGFRFLGGGGADVQRFDKGDVLADPNGEIVYTPLDAECFAEASRALNEVVSGVDSHFRCRGSEYGFTFKGGRIAHNMFYGEIASAFRQTRGFKVALQRISRMGEPRARALQLAGLTSSMLLAGSDEYAVTAAARMRKEMARIEDEAERADAIFRVCAIISGDQHPMGMTAPLFGTLLPCARSIEDPRSLASALSCLALAMGSNSSPRSMVAVAGAGEMDVVSCAGIFAEAEEAALMILGRQDHYATRASIARDMGIVGMRSEAYSAFDEMLGEIETVALFQDNADTPSSEANDFFAGFVEVLLQIDCATLGEYEFPLARDAIMLIEFIGDESICRDAIRAAQALIARSNHIDSERMAGVLAGLSLDLDGISSPTS